MGGGIRNPSLLLTAPLLEGGTGSTAPPSASVFSSSAVGQAFQTLQTDLQTDVPSGARPTHASVGALEDDLVRFAKARSAEPRRRRRSRLTRRAILTSMGLTQAQVTQIQSDQQAIADRDPDGDNGGGVIDLQRHDDSRAGLEHDGGFVFVVRLDSPVCDANPADGPSIRQSQWQPAHPRVVGAVEDDLDAIRMGTLSSSAAVTQVQTDAAAVLASMGMTSAQITQIQADQAAVATALQPSRRKLDLDVVGCASTSRLCSQFRRTSWAFPASRVLESETSAPRAWDQDGAACRVAGLAIGDKAVPAFRFVVVTEPRNLFFSFAGSRRIRIVARFRLSLRRLIIGGPGRVMPESDSGRSTHERIDAL